MQTTHDRTDTELVRAVIGGDSEAYGTLFERWFNNAWNVARTIVRDDDLAADVAQDALLTAWQRLGQLDNPDAFGGWLLRITRNRALNRLQREQRSRSTGHDVVSGMRDAGAPDAFGAQPTLGPDAVNEVRDRQEMVWAAAEALGAREVSLLDLHLRHGLGAAEIAEELGVEANNAHQQLYRLRTRLGEAIGSYMLWRHGRPLCESLAAAVSGKKAFDKSVARAVKRHQATCDACSEERAAMVDPGKLFAGVPLVAVPIHLKTNAAAALESAGVPMGGHAGPPGSNGPSNTPDPDPTGSNGASNTPDPTGTSGSPDTPGSNGSSNTPDPAGVGGTSGSPGTGNAVPLASNPAVPVTAVATGPILDQPVPGHHVPTIVQTGLLEENRNLLLVVTGTVSAVVVAALTLLFLNLGSGESGNAQAIAVGADQALTDEDITPPAGPAASAQDSEGADQGSLEPSPDRSEPEEETTDQGQQAAASNEDEPAVALPPTTIEPPPTPVPPTTEVPPTTLPPTTLPPTPSDTEVTPPEVPPTTTIPAETTAPEPVEDPVTTPTTEPDTTTRPPDPNPDPDPDPPDDSAPVRTTVTTEQRPSDPPDTPDPPTQPDRAEIVRFSSRRQDPPSIKCVGRAGTAYEALWATENADTVTLTIGSESTVVKASGSKAFCGTTGQVLKLTATGPGGGDEAKTTL